MWELDVLLEAREEGCDHEGIKALWPHLDAATKVANLVRGPTGDENSFILMLLKVP